MALRAVCLKKPAAETILGIGVGWNRSRKSLTSSFDYVSLEAFETLGVRRGVRHDHFEWWLPLAINAAVRIDDLGVR
ncbi:MAG: hypothetical protein INR71_06095 [Terriglobus roseus]|nr:hypothetical protein [Terriglobus roseus]